MKTSKQERDEQKKKDLELAEEMKEIAKIATRIRKRILKKYNIKEDE